MVIKVLPIFPRFPLTFWGFQKSLPYVGKKATMPPTGLATILAMLPKEFEPQRIIDLNVEKLEDKDIKNSDIIFTSSMIIQENSHNEILDRAHFYGKKVVAGGPFPSSYPERNEKADYIVAGEAEITFNAFLEDFLQGKAKRVYTEEGVIKSGRNSSLLTKNNKPLLETTPIPRWDLLNLNQYNSPAIQYSRGCPYNCEFCDITKLFGREPRTKTPKQMLLELDAVHEQGYTGSIFIVDDNFIGNKKNVRQLLPEIIKWQKEKDYPFSFFTEASMELAWDENKDILEQMVSAKFNQVFLGIESTDLDALTKINKKQNLKMSQAESIKRIQNAGLEATGGFIIGLDGEKPEVFDQLYNFIQTSGIVVPMSGLLTVLKGTNLYNRLVKEDRMITESTGNNTHNLAFNFKPQLDERFLIEGYKKLLQKLFEPKNYYERCRILQDNIGEINTRNRMNLEGLTAFAKSLNNHLVSRGGFEYLKYITRTAIKNPRYFPEAITHAIKLEHFREITKETIKSDDYNYKIESLYDKFKKKTEQISLKYSDDFQKQYEKVSNIAENLKKSAEKKYLAIHEDFRGNAKKVLDDFQLRINGELEKYIQQPALQHNM
ncbi:MAG: B12-binding domain-containing radical SAM protein [Nanoarchaeota archaeon]|nr:B12-binding domain-containing radical SAM protein [Nanoarchaeota archaeon]